jgi:environmental stress-induced protein Ves
VLRAGGYRRMRWKNGLGETAEIAVSPADAPLETFDWRISMARVDTGGPFSTFDCIDRTLTVLDGEGIRLSVGAAAAVEITPGSGPFRFRGDDPASAELLGGAVTDLNVMTRRGRCAHQVWVARPGERIAALDGTVVLFCGCASVVVRNGLQTATLDPRDALVVESGSGEMDWQGALSARLLVIHIAAAGLP